MIIKLAGYITLPRSRLPANLDLSLWVNVTENLKRFFLFLYPYIRTNKEDRNTDVNIYILYICSLMRVTNVAIAASLAQW